MCVYVYAGGEYIYILESLGPLPAFLCLWIMFASIGAVANACNGLVFATYLLRPFFGDCAVPLTLQKIVGILVICIFLCRYYSVLSYAIIPSLFLSFLP